MNVDYAIADLVVVVVYVLVLVVTLYAAFLYRNAYVQMKRTPMIASVYALMVALALDSTYWLFVTVGHDFGLEYANIMLTPWFAVIPKFLLLAAASYFLFATLSPSPHQERAQEACEAARSCKDKPKEEKNNG